MAPLWFKREIHLGDSGPDVTTAQRILGLAPGVWDESCAALLHGYYRTAVLTADVAEQIGESATVAAGLPPLWFTRDLAYPDEGDDVLALSVLLGEQPTSLFTQPLSDALRRWQGNHGIAPTGIVTEREAILLGDTE